MPVTEKIVIICPYLYRLTRGIERFCISLSKAMADEGREVIIYAWAPEHGTSREKSCGELPPSVRVRVVPRSRWYQEIVAVTFYRLWLRKDRPKAVILNFLYHGESRLPRRLKYLYVLHSPASQVPGRYQFLKAHAGRFTNLHIVAISGMVEREARPYSGTTPISLIYNGTDTSIFRPSDARKENERLRIITAAAFEERKGMHFVIEALAGFKYRDKVEYDIYGSGNSAYESRLRRMIDETGLSGTVRLKGSVANLPELMPHYDLFALPSRGEAFALSPIEAMACGLPILVSDCNPYPEFVNPEFGCMVRQGDAEAVRSFLSRLIEEKGEKELMGKAAREKSLEFSWKRKVKEYLALIDR